MCVSLLAYKPSPSIRAELDVIHSALEVEVMQNNLPMQVDKQSSPLYQGWVERGTTHQSIYPPVLSVVWLRH